MTSFILIIAHPDDESMFFLPTLYTLVNDMNFSRPPFPSSLHILCLSNGNYHKLGTQRERELFKAAAIISDQIQVTIINHWKLQDGPKESWSSNVICEVIHKFLQEKQIVDKAVVLLTFDEWGVSGHVNHMDVYKGVMDFFDTSDQRALDLELWTLHSVRNVLVKYLPLGDVLKLVSCWCQSLCRVRSFVSSSSSLSLSSSSNSSTHCRFMMFNPTLVWRAMKAHYSQFVWYRKLFVIFSRYSYVNDWTVHSHSRNVQGMKLN